MTRSIQQSNRTGNEQMLSPGKIFQKRRVALRKSVQQVCDETKIQEKYIKMLENDEFDRFETEVFMIGFIKIYSKYLGLNVEKILALTRRMLSKQKEKAKVVIKKEQERKTVSPKLVITIVLSLFVIAVILYFFFQLYNFQQVPTLIVTSPEDNITVEEDVITVEGYTDDNVVLLINGINRDVESDGSFAEEISLVEGQNSISVQSIRESNKSKESVIVVTVTYTPRTEVEEKEEIEEEPQISQMRLEVLGGDAWIQLLIDGEQIVGNTVIDGYSEKYTIEEDFQVITGKSSITSVYLDDSTDPLPWSISDGVGSINCRLVKNTFSCDN